MSLAKLTTIGLWKYRKDHNMSDLFELLVLPEAIDRDTLINNILMRAGEFEVLWPDADYMHDAIGVFSNKWQRTFIKWVEANEQYDEFNPLENFDRKEDWTENSVGSSSNTRTLNTTTATTGSGTVEAQKAAYNSNNYENVDKSIDSNSGSSHDTGTIGDITAGDNQVTHSGRLHGNIGVTRTSDLYLSSVEAAKVNIIENITDLYIAELTLPIYC